MGSSSKGAAAAGNTQAIAAARTTAAKHDAARYAPAFSGRARCLLPRTYANTDIVLRTAAVLLIVNCNQSVPIRSRLSAAPQVHFLRGHSYQHYVRKCFVSPNAERALRRGALRFF